MVQAFKPPKTIKPIPKRYWLVFNLTRVGKGLGVSFGILAAGIVSVFYAILTSITLETIIADLEIVGFKIPKVGTISYIVVFLSLILTNVATYAFTTEIPMHLTRKKNSFIQFLAHILSSSVSAFI